MSNKWVNVDTDGSIQDAVANPLLKPTGMFEWILGDPTIVDVEDVRYVFTNEIFHGIIWYRVERNRIEGEIHYKYNKLGSVIGYPGAVRPYAHYDLDLKKIYLYYEQYQFPWYKSSKIMLRTGVVSGNTISWDKQSTVILEPKLSWELVGTQRVGNPFVFWNPSKEMYHLYYSASSVYLEDSKIDEPVDLGLATSKTLEGPWERVSNEPLIIKGIDEKIHMGFGSLKLVKGIDQNYDHPVAIINRVTNIDGVTGSIISLVKSADGGNSFELIRDLIKPSLVKKDWKEAYCYGFDTTIDESDGNYILIMYNGRDGWASCSEAVGVSRIRRDIFNV